MAEQHDLERPAQEPQKGPFQGHQILPKDFNIRNICNALNEITCSSSFLYLFYVVQVK
jgi:hypothetical protein